MRSYIAEIALATTLATALISATPALARDRQTLAAGHDFARQTANDAWATRNDNYGRQNQWDPWGHWGNYYGPML